MNNRFLLNGLSLFAAAFFVSAPVWAAPTATERLREVIGMLQPSECEYYWNIDTTRARETKKGTYTVAYAAKKSVERWGILIAAPDTLKGRALLRDGNRYWARNPGELQNRQTRGGQTFLGGILTNKDVFPLMLERSRVVIVSDERNKPKTAEEQLTEHEKIVQNERFGILLETGHVRIKQRRNDDILDEKEVPPQLVMRLTPNEGGKLDGYTHGLLSVDADSNRPRWFKLFGVGDRLLKYFVYNDFKRMSDGRPHPAKTEVYNGLNRSFKSELNLGNIRCTTMPATAFHPNRLSQLGKLLLR
ncbi:outer membrane lipoprotein-sorting protein [Magnetococcus sp. PR-3]|uniref:outer membrane lipoprotein-sorting protein n=1 Tax=Magnetococcus sp. PR-3 TaxID=3120355 RepID=UPI002FCDF9A9